MGQSTIYSMVYLLKMPGSIMAMWPFDPRYRCRDHAGGLAEYHQARQQAGGEARGQGDRPECSLAANPDGWRWWRGASRVAGCDASERWWLRNPFNMGLWICLDIHIYICIWVNLITTSLFSRTLRMMVSKGNHPQMAEPFRLVKYYNWPRYMYRTTSLRGLWYKHIEGPL